MSIPFTYLIGWSKLNKWYYGVRYAKNCNPTDLWSIYFTSSKFVKQFRKDHGEPDVTQVRRVFASSKHAKRWEDKVLARLKVSTNEKWLNTSTNYSFRSVDRSWNEGLTKHTSATLRRVAKSISNTWQLKIKNGYTSSNRGRRRNIESRKLNSWKQLVEHHPNLPFTSHQQFIDYCIQEYQKGLGIYTIASNLGIKNGTVISRQLKFAGIVPQVDQTMSKILKRMPDFPFKEYSSFSAYCNEQYMLGVKATNIATTLSVSYDAVKRALATYAHHNSNS